MKHGIWFASLALILAAGCAYEGRRVDTSVEAVASHEFNPKDLQLVAQTADRLIQRGVLSADRKPAVFMKEVLNRTDDHVNTSAIREYLAVKLDETGRIQLVERSGAKDTAVRELEWQQGAFADPTTAKQVGKMVGADYFLVGELTNISVRGGSKKGQFFLFTLTLVEVETLKSWKAAQEIQKVSKRGLFGW